MQRQSDHGSPRSPKHQQRPVFQVKPLVNRTAEQQGRPDSHLCTPAAMPPACHQAQHQQQPHQQRSQASQPQLWTRMEGLPEDIAHSISKLAHEMSQRECIRQLRTALRRRAARIYKQKRDVLMNMDDDHPQITTAREEVLYYHALAVGLDISSCWEIARIWPDELEILHCLPELV